MSATTANAPSACLLPMAASSLAGAAPINPRAEGGAEKKSNINPELWQACAGPLINLPTAGTLVYYFPQGHSEQVAASMKKNSDAQIPNYPNLPSKLLCILHSITLHADAETDDVYAQMTLQPVPSYDREALLRSDLSLKTNKPQSESFCKTLTASDTSTHGGFSVPRRAADKIFPPLDFSMTPPAQELVARDLHDNAWTFRHIYRGQPKRHLLTTGWSLFVSGKRLFAGDSVLFIRDEKQQLLLGIRRSNRQSSNLSSSVLSSDSMHIGILAAAAHAAANNSPFTVYYNPRASPSEFVVPLAKYYKAMFSNQISLGMRFRMMFETEDSGTRRFMGTITGISDLDPQRWQNSQWRNLQVGWDESTAGERRNRVSIWEIEPVTGPFFLCPPFFRPKRPRPPDDESLPWMGDEMGLKDPTALSGLSLIQWMNMQQNSTLPNLPPQIPYRMNQQLPQIDQTAKLQAQILQQQLLSQPLPVQPQPVYNPPPDNQIPAHLLQKLQQQTQLTQPFPSRIGMQGQSIITEEGPSCSTSPSAANNRFISQPMATVPHPEIPAKPLNQEFLSPLTYLNGGHVDYIDTSSSTTSEVNLHNVNTLPFTQPQNTLRVTEEEFPANITTEDLDLSSSLISQSQPFSLPDPSFPPLNDLSKPTWAQAQAQPFQRVRTFKKVYKRGAVGRSVDITAYTGYDELKRDLARRFGIEGQLEDRQRIGWKLVYVDHENDILLVGDDPWEEFVNCVKCIKILSPQEVQQMSLDVGDVGRPALANQACSSSDN